MDLDTKRVDSKAIRDGEWVGEEFGTPIPGWGDLCLKVRGLNCAALRDLRGSKAMTIQPSDRLPTGDLKAEVADRMYAESIDEAILLGWKNLSIGGKEVKHSKAEQTRILLDPDYRFLIGAIETAAGMVGVIRDKAEKAIEKN